MKRSGTGNETIRNYKNNINIHKKKCYDTNIKKTKDYIERNKHETERYETKRNETKMKSCRPPQLQQKEMERNEKSKTLKQNNTQ